MSHVPRPSTVVPESTLSRPESDHKPGHSSTLPVTNPPSYKALAIVSDKGGEKNDKRSSYLSTSGSQASWIRSPAISPPARSISLASRSTISTEQYGVYRPDTPQAALSPSTSSIFSLAYTGIASSHFSGGPPPQLPPPYGHFPDPPTSSPRKDRPPFLPNPFLEPPSRSGTPASVTSFRSDGFLYTSPQLRSQTGPMPRNLLAGGWPIPSSTQYPNPQGFPAVGLGEKIDSPALEPELAFQRLRNNLVPLNLRAGIEMRDTCDSLQSPDQMSVVSRSASIQFPSIDMSASSLSLVPRSPSPHSLPSHMVLPTSLKAFALPAHPRLYPVNLRGPQRFHEVRRVESSPNLMPDGPFTVRKQGHLMITPKREAAPLPVAPDYMRQVRFIST